MFVDKNDVSTPSAPPAEGTKQVKIRRKLHKLLKEHAVQKDKTLQEVVEDQCWPLVGGEPKEGGK